MKVDPTEAQAVFLTAPVREIMYGGAGGGGKSVALLTAAAQYLDTPGYNAILFRNSLTDLQLPDSLIPMSHNWWAGSSARWNGTDHKWTFPCSKGGYSTLSFGYIQTDADKYRYKSAQFQLIGFDELTQFQRDWYLFLFSRLRKPKTLDVPLRMRSATNPGGPGHDWVKLRFIKTLDINRLFVPAQMVDNPHLDQEEYESTLDELDQVTRAQIKKGDWDTRPEGIQFKKEWFKRRLIDHPPCTMKRVVRFWDLAGMKAKRAKAKRDPDFTAGVKIGLGVDDNVYVLDVKKRRGTPSEIERLIVRTADDDGYEVHVGMEEEGGASGKFTTDRFKRLLIGHTFLPVHSSGDKVTRSDGCASACENGLVWIISDTWTEEFMEELGAFDGVTGNDDQVDAFVSGFNLMVKRNKRPWTKQGFERVFSRSKNPKDRVRDLLLQKLNASRNVVSTRRRLFSRR